jgi:hypothetical protein
MAFVTGLITGLFIGATSWLALAAWLETRRLWGKFSGRNRNEIERLPLEQLYHHP